jgi:alkylhydroperoxidase family enzyme
MTIVHHPTLFRRWVALIDAFTNESTLPPRNRELLILRTAWNCKSAYEWSRHAGPRKDCLSELEVKNIPAGPTAESWSKLDATLLTAADELHDQSRLSADTWSNLAQHFTQQQLIELVMLVGAYHLVAFSTNSFGVALDEGLSGLPNL